jgi:enterobacterial common antigen flippase
MIARDALQTMVARVAILAAGIVASIVSARVLGPAGRGIYYFVLMLGITAVQFGSLGLHASNTYLVAHDRGRFGSLLGISVWVSLVVGTSVAALIVLVVMAFTPETHAGATALWAVAYTPVALFVLLASNLFIGAGRTGSYNALQLCAAILAMLGAIVVALVRGPVSAFLGALVVATAVTALLALVYGLRIAPAGLGFDRALFASGARYAGRAFIVGLLSFSVTRLNVFIMARESSADELGYYSVAMQFFDTLSILPNSIATVLLPKLITDGNSWSVARRAAGLTALLLIPACLLTAVLAQPLIRVVFGVHFAGAVWPTILVLPAAFFIGVVSVLSQYLAAGGFPRRIIWIWGLAVLVMSVSGLLLVPRHGAGGAAVALSCTYLAVLVMMAVAAARFRPDHA